jgi:hypothetical protein
MSSKELNLPKEQKKLQTPSSKLDSNENISKINMEKGAENLSDDENLSGFDSDSECENGQNGMMIKLSKKYLFLVLQK